MRVIAIITFLCLVFPMHAYAGKFQKQDIDQTKHYCIDYEDEMICHHYQAKQDLTLESFAAGRCNDLKFELVQIGKYITANPIEPVYLPEDRCNKEGYISDPLKLPRVRSITRFDIRISSVYHSGDETENTKPWQYIPVLVYPTNLLEPLKKIADSKTVEFNVHDKSGKIKQFLEKHDINYAKQKSDQSKNNIALISGYKDFERFLADHEYTTAIIFTEKVIDLPQLRVISNSDKTTIYVEMKILDQLEHLPVQKSFMRIIKLALNPDNYEWRAQ